MPALLDIAIVAIDEALRQSKRALTDAYSEYTTPAGKTLSAFVSDNFLFPLSEFYARLRAFIEVKIRESASQGTPFGATGSNLDRWLEFKKVPIPQEQFSQVTIEVTGDDLSLPSGWFAASIAGFRYTLDSGLVFAPGGETIEVNATAEAAGSDSNVSIGDILELDPTAGLDTVAPVIAILQTGADPSDDDAKSRLLEASFAGDAGVGTEGWYISQTLGFDGAFGNVFTLPQGYGVGSVVLYPLLRLTESELLNTPWMLKPASQAQADSVTTRWSDPTIRIVLHRVFGAVLLTPAIDIDLTITPDTSDTRAAAIRALRDRFAEDYSAKGYKIANSEIVGAVTTAIGITSIVIDDITAGTGADDDNVPVPGAGADVYALQGESLIVGTVTFL